MSSPYFSYPGVLQGRIQPVYKQAKDGSWSYVLGSDEKNLPIYRLNIGDEIQLEQTFEMTSSARLLKFDWLMRYSPKLPEYEKVADALPVDFRNGDLLVTGDSLRGIEAPSAIFRPEHKEQLCKISGSTSNNEDNVRISAVPSGQGQDGWFDLGKPTAAFDAGQHVVLEKTITAGSADPATIEVYGAQWRATMEVQRSGDGSPTLRAELVESLVQSDPEGWQRGSFAAHISKISVPDDITIFFTLSLESITG